MNGTDTIEAAFSDYYRTTVLSEETDPNKLHNLQADLDGYEVYDGASIDSLVDLYLGSAERDQLDPIPDACVATYNEDLDEDEQVDFKGKAKAFVRTYGFLASIRPYSNPRWEKLSIFLNFLILKLPAPKSLSHKPPGRAEPSERTVKIPRAIRESKESAGGPELPRL